MQLPSYSWPAVMQDMKQAGVVQRPSGTTRAPALARPAANASVSAGPLSRGSLPMETRSADTGLPHCEESQWAKATPRKEAASGVSVTACPSTPSSATPRTSEPFCRRA